jgi:hypothetical protein
MTPDAATGAPTPGDAVCVCGKPATGFVNVTANAASSVPAVMKPRCDEHNPYGRMLADHDRASAAADGGQG